MHTMAALVYKCHIDTGAVFSGCLLMFDSRPARICLRAAIFTADLKKKGLREPTDVPKCSTDRKMFNLTDYDYFSSIDLTVWV